MLTHTNSSPVMDVDWSGDGDSNTSSPNTNRLTENHDVDSFSEEEDFSDEFSVIDSDDERRTEGRIISHQIIQVNLFLYARSRTIR